MQESIETLIKAENDKNYDVISKTAHKMKSNIDSMGIISLKLTIRELEIVSPENDNSKQLIEKIRTTLKNVFIQLKSFDAVPVN